MDPSEGGYLPPGSSSSNLQAFQALISSYEKAHKAAPSRFVKKLGEIPKVVVHSSSAGPLAIKLAYKGLIGKFKILWPSPKAMHHWLELNWHKLTQG